MIDVNVHQGYELRTGQVIVVIDTPNEYLPLGTWLSDRLGRTWRIAYTEAADDGMRLYLDPGREMPRTEPVPPPVGVVQVGLQEPI